MKLKTLSLLTVVIFTVLISIIITSVYYFWFKETSTSYSFTQTYKNYFSLEDWNLSLHVLEDIDGDGKQDMITFTNCVFLTSTSEALIPENSKCEEPEMSPIGFPNNEKSVGQRLVPSKPFLYTLLKKSYLVQTHDNNWKFYDVNGFQIRTYQLNEDGLFIETIPTIIDKIDAVSYQISHLGIMIFLSTNRLFY